MRPVKPHSRRRFLKIVAATSAGAFANAFPLGQVASAASRFHYWQGPLLGTEGSIALEGAERKVARKLFQRCSDEIKRLEQIFSLYIPNSSIRRLNREGYLNNPPPELVDLLTQSGRLSAETAGVFDVSLQPLWHYLYYLTGANPDPRRVDQLRKLIDYRKIHISDQRIEFAQPGMQITLNGVAQGYITDRVAHLLRSAGSSNVLIDLGEYFGMGTNPRGEMWKVGVRHPAREEFIAYRELNELALATSAGMGTTFVPDGSLNHLIDATVGRSVNLYQSVTVCAPNATTADALSTALSFLPRDRQHEILRLYRGSSAIILTGDNQIEYLK